jgi:hypothetical protein
MIWTYALNWNPISHFTGKIVYVILFYILYMYSPKFQNTTLYPPGPAQAQSKWG